MKILILSAILSIATAAEAHVRTTGVRSVSAEPVETQKVASQKSEIMASVEALENRIKSCLAGIYDEQMELHKDKGTFSAVTTELRTIRSRDCESLDLSTQMADGEEFTVVARSGDMVWSVDQSKTIEQIR